MDLCHGVMTATTLTAIAPLAVVWLLLRNKLLKPLDNVVEQLERLANGDLSVQKAVMPAPSLIARRPRLKGMRMALSESG